MNGAYGGSLALLGFVVGIAVASLGFSGLREDYVKSGVMIFEGRAYRVIPLVLDGTRQ